MIRQSTTPPLLTYIVSEDLNADVLGFVHGNDGGLDGVLELGPGLTGPVHQGERPAEPLP